MNALAFISTSFGFGPVSKAVSIAGELKAESPRRELHYFGEGIAHDYAHKSGVFDRVFRVDVDRHDSLSKLVPTLASYRAVVSVMNFELLPLWPRTPPLYLVDSLAWMWPGPPPGIENVRTYFVQDYLLTKARADEWRERVPLVVIAPVETASELSKTKPWTRRNQLLVNFSGAANPFAPRGLYEMYGLVLGTAILSAAQSRYEKIVICCNESLAAYLRARLDAASVSIGHFPHEEFVELLLTSRMLLSAPGITTTLEATATDTPVKFLLPQNDSQALLGETYRELLGDDACIPFSRFGPEFSFPRALPKDAAVILALEMLDKILRGRGEQVSAAVKSLFNSSQADTLKSLKRVTGRWGAPGQRVIASHIL